MKLGDYKDNTIDAFGDAYEFLIENILRLFTERKDVEYTAKVVPNAVIGENDFNLSVSTYVEKQDTREKVDIKELNK